MATFLSRLGRLAFRRRWVVILVWVALLGGIGAASAAAAPLPEESRSMPGIEAQDALDLMRERFPGNPENATARVVFVAPQGGRLTEGGTRAAVERLVTDMARGSQVTRVASPFQTRAVSGDGSTAFATIAYAATPGDLTDGTRQQLQDAIDRARSAGVTVEVSGTVLTTRPQVGGVSEVVGLGLAAVVLLITFGSLAAAGLPLLTAILGVAVSMLAILTVGSTFGLSTTSSTLAIMLGLAVGIDYALFIISRYREERANGYPPREAAGVAVGTAGSAVVVAGLTVIITLAGLAVVGIPAAARMGLAAAGAVAVAVLIALTLVPALLGLFPDAVVARRIRRGGPGPAGAEGPAADNSPAAASHPAMATGPGATTGAAAATGAPAATGAAATGNGGARWARFVLRRPAAVALVSAAFLAVLALPVTQLQLGMPGDEARSTETTERRAYDAMARAFGPGANGPLTIVVDARGTGDPQAAARTIAQRVAAVPGVVAVSPPQLNPGGDTALFTATSSAAPTSEQTKELVQRIRDGRAATQAGTGASFLVTGATAVNIDVAAKVPGALVPYLAVVLGLAFVLLMAIFRSLLVPLKALFGFLLSVLASIGVVVAVFQWGWGADLLGIEQTGPIISMMPIMMVGIIFGLAMDYEVFLVSRMREAHLHGEPAREAIVSGFRHSARVVVAAALIMIAVFAGFVGADLVMIKMIGFSLAVGVLLDAFVVRMALVPAVLAMLGERAWSLPGWLDRLLPHVDLEGDGLVRAAAAAPAAEAPPAEPVRQPVDG